MAEFALPHWRAPQRSRGTLVSLRIVHCLALVFSLALSAAAHAVTPQISAGDTHTVALKSDGTLWAWGLNAYGQVGDGTTSRERASPVAVGADSNWAAVAAGKGENGRAHTVALKTDGTLWAWGHNGFGELGDGTPLSRSSPVQIGSTTNWMVVSTGSNYTVALKSDGTLWTWGFNAFGAVLGDGTIGNSRFAPAQVGTVSNWTTVAAGYDHTLAIRNDGTLWAWGYNSFGQL